MRSVGFESTGLHTILVWQPVAGKYLKGEGLTRRIQATCAKLAKEFGVDFYESSAKNDINVEQSFLGIARAVKDRVVAEGGGAPANSGMKLKKDPVSGGRKANGCC